MKVLSVAFYPCPECGRQAKCLEVRKRVSGNSSWKYRRYECAGEHKFSTAEQVYKPVQNRKPDLPKKEINDDD